MEFIKKILQTQLFKISSLNSISVFIKLFIGIITSKMLAVFVGPGGMAYIGNFRNFMTSLEGVSTLAFSSGVIKYIGENEGNEKELSKIITTVLITFLFLSTIIGLLLFSFSSFITTKIFGNNIQYEIIFKVVAIVLPFSVISSLFVSIINGLGKYNKLVYATIVSNIIAIILTASLIYEFKLVGALISIAVNPIILFTVNFFYVPKELQIIKRIDFKEYDFVVIKKLAGFSIMILPSFLLSPYITLEIRKFLIITVGLDESGFWEAITKVSNLYLIFISTLVSLYFYPQLIKAKSKKQTKEVFLQFYKSIIPLFVCCAVVIYFIRFWIVKTLFSNEFLPVSDLFLWQIIGDFFKVCGTIIAFQFLAKRIIVPYIIFEFSANVFLYFFSIYCIELVGIQGVLIAQAAEHCLYLIVITIYFRKLIF